jgi:hypothetical protein
MDNQYYERLRIAELTDKVLGFEKCEGASTSKIKKDVKEMAEEIGDSA